MTGALGDAIRVLQAAGVDAEESHSKPGWIICGKLRQDDSIPYFESPFFIAPDGMVERVGTRKREKFASMIEAAAYVIAESVLET